MPWCNHITVGDRMAVAGRIGAGTVCKKVWQTAKGGSLPRSKWLKSGNNGWWL
jgi:hypothetical protein